ncbi:Multiple organellar RNA editing factor 6, mitochondrial [Capsicum annuum]|uniref:Multiple organellar RNA editing factor 6, mitochondrial n=1 Tax=Capsicum annuum TaxID=4072 RepID=A0A1U8GY57_CAPAN|nr:multiple organellar RNA editing factor 2, chloroplastic [Capsicum annuum]XP_047268784.1 multiple organellar RNA editing factor 2, chloroplastic [Capsicum annuum]KAF3630185.1 Multiple organellar RNA editing factor 6, mitochondrial [Capsicum annuum]KAF3646553.1 Multiple organellar RNA editing factor 6, mitochondrial [Capsicum annuum]PHT62002.1 Multiple organellar RNA editing factor 6, mitochondrial [Capsicum annuum]
MASKITRSLYTSRFLSSSLRFLSSTSSSSSPSISHTPISTVRSSFLFSHSLYPNFPKPFSFNPVRFRMNRSGGNSPYTPGTGDRAPTEMAPLFPGCDYEHWLIVMDKPGGEGASKQQMIDCYVQTLAKVVGSEEEAIKKIYNVSCERYFGFGCEVDEETSNKMEGLPGVLFVLPDSYVDPEYKDYGAELFVNGQIVQRSPERQRRVEPVPQRNDRIRPNRFNRRRDNMR